MWAHLLNVVLTGILYLEWQHHYDSRLETEPNEKPQSLGDDDFYDDYPTKAWPEPMLEAAMNQLDESGSLSPFMFGDGSDIDSPQTELYARDQKDAMPDVLSFSMSILEAGMNPMDVMTRYIKETEDCRYVFYGIVSLLHPENENYDRTKFNRAIQAVSIETFLSTSVEFCREAILSSYEIISVGCGDGTIEREVIAAYRERFDSDIKITLVDPAHKVDYKVVPELIEKRPEVVGNCALLIIWPELPSKNDGYDIDAIRKLRPRTVLTVYEINGVTGSSEFHNFLRNDSYKLSDDKRGLKNIFTEIFTRLKTPRDPNNYGAVDKYEMEQVVLEEIFCSKFLGTDITRMVKLKRVD